MTKFQLDHPDGPWDYPALGFRATDGAILDGTLFDPEITDPPDAWWSVYGGGSAQTGITSIFPYGSAGTYVQPTDNTLPIYKRTDRNYRLLSPADWVAEPEVDAALSVATAEQAVGRTSRAKHAPALGIYYPEAEGAVGDGVTDDSAAIRAAIDACVAAGGGTVELTGDYLANTTVGFQSYDGVTLQVVLPITGDGVRLHLAPGCRLRTTANAFAFIAALGPAKGLTLATAQPGHWENQAVYTINPAAQDAISVTTATAAQAGNFTPGDTVMVRSGNCVNTSQGGTDPDAELSRVVAADSGTGVITLSNPLVKPYVQENYTSGSTGASKVGGAGTAAPLGIAKISADQIIEGFRIDGPGELVTEGIVAIVHLRQVRGARFGDNLRVTFKRTGVSSRGSVDVKVRGRWVRDATEAAGTAGEWVNLSMCSGDIDIDIDGYALGALASVVLVEGCYRFKVNKCRLLNKGDSSRAFNVINLAARYYDGSVLDNTVANGGTSPAIIADNSVTVAGTGADVRTTVENNKVSGGPFTFAIRTEEPGAIQRNNRVGALLASTSTSSPGNATGHRPMEVMSVPVNYSQASATIGTLPAEAVVTNVRIHVLQAFDAGSTDTIAVGWSGNTAALGAATDVKTTGFKTATAGSQVGYNSSGAARTLIATHAQTGTAATQGKAVVMVEFYRVARVN